MAVAQSVQIPGQEGHVLVVSPPRTNTMAILSLIFAFFISLLAVIFGHLARNQIRRTGEEGWGLATAGLVIGYIGLVLGTIGLIVYVAVVASIFR